MKVAFILSGLPDGLKYLDKNREKVATKLKEYGWEIRAFTFSNLTSLNSHIQEFYDEEIEDFIFFYTGHGNTSNQDNVLTLKLHDGTLVDINSLNRDYFSKLKFKKMSIVLDACYSGNFNDQKIRDNMEYLCSSDFDEESFECDTLEQSFFSYYFCEAMDQLSGEITLNHINDYLKRKIEKQHSKHLSFDSKMVIVDKVLQEAKDKILSEYQPILTYISEKSITLNTLLHSAKKYLNLKKYDIVSTHKTIEKLIPHLADTDILFCVIKDIFQNDDQRIEQWIEENRRSCEEIQASGEPRVVIIFKSKNNAKKYDVNFISVDLPSASNENDTYDLADEDSKNNFIKKMMSYIKFNPTVDLILPIELMTENINLWEVEFNKSLSTLSKLNIRHDIRYFSENDIKNLIVKDWEKIEEKIEDANPLFPVNNTGDIRNVGNNMPNCGVCANTVLSKEHFKYLLDSEMGYIMLWLTQACSEDLIALSTNIKELKCRYYALNNKPINLMYDDPNTYYYPSKGEKR
jgi:hypothetical protein